MCIVARKRIKGWEEDACAALIGQTMYSACFILSRFINVNIFHPPLPLPENSLFSPLLLISAPAFPRGGRKRRKINWSFQSKCLFFRRKYPLLSAPITRSFTHRVPPPWLSQLRLVRYLASCEILSFRFAVKEMKCVGQRLKITSLSIYRRLPGPIRDILEILPRQHLRPIYCIYCNLQWTSGRSR